MKNLINLQPLTGPVKILILVALGIFAMRTFWGPEFFDGHDALSHLVRLEQFDKVLKEGQIPPRWAPDLYAGRGYPLFIFVYPLPYFIAEGWHWLGFSLAVSLKLTFVLAYLASLIGMYYLAGFTGAILWGVAPYMFVKIFITGSLGVVTAFAFIPWFFFSLRRRNWLAAAVFMALWIMSHLGKLVVFAPLVLLFFWERWKNYRQILIMTALALLLSAWYLVPANWELGFTHYRDFVSHQYQNDFVPLSRLFYSKWGTNAPGWGANPLSQQVGIAQWLAIGLGLIFWRKTWPYLIVFGVSIFLMLKESRFIWDFPTPLQAVGTPWRFLSLAVFSSAIVGGKIVSQIKAKSGKIMISLLLIFLALYGNRNHMRINDKRVYDEKFFQDYTGVATGWNEHLPVWVKSVDFVRPASPPPGQLNTLFYPGWQVKVDDRPVTIWPSENGLIQFATPSAEAKIESSFSDTPVRKISKIISFASIIGLIVIWIKKLI